jgi:hypothetical protein
LALGVIGPAQHLAGPLLCLIALALDFGSPLALELNLSAEAGDLGLGTPGHRRCLW